MIQMALMKIGAGNWLLTAYGLNDLASWTRFDSTSANPDLDRTQFIEAIERASLNDLVRLHPRRELHRRGRCVYEYGWEMDEDTILAHAMAVAADLNVELIIGEYPPTLFTPHSAA